MKVVGIDSKAKACQWCGAKPACPDWTCKRLSSVSQDETGWQVWFVETVEFTFTPEPGPNE
jgi:hypothetical protein